MAKHLVKLRNEAARLNFVFLGPRSHGTPDTMHIDHRTARFAKLLIILIAHKPQTAAIPALIREVDYGRQATIVLVEECLFIHSNRSELQQVNLGRVQPFDLLQLASIRMDEEAFLDEHY